MAVRIIPIAFPAPNRTALRLKMKYQRDLRICYLSKRLLLGTNQTRSLNSASIVEVIISRDTGPLMAYGVIFAVPANGNLLLRIIYFI